METHFPQPDDRSADVNKWDDDEEEDSTPVQETRSRCRCAMCCRRLLIEVGVEDAEREPKIRELASPIKELTDEVIGYLLNSKTDMACVFLNRTTNLCTIYETRPDVCRAFDCDGEGRRQLVELGILPSN